MKAQNVVQDLQTLANSQKAEHSKRFFKTGKGEYGEGDKFLGIKVPPQHEIAKKYVNLGLTEVEKLLQSKYHEVRLTASMLLVYKVEKGNRETLGKVADLYLKNLSCFNNWDIIDGSAPKILGPYFEDRERDILYEWAQSEDLWEKRIAMLTCYHFIKNKDYKDALNIAEILLNDTHDLIHKATGWMLREIGNQDQKAEEEFLKNHYKQMPRTMLRYAIEKFDEPLRKKYLNGTV